MAKKSFFCIDGHTCGNPVRLVAGGGPGIRPAATSAAVGAQAPESNAR